MTKIGTKLLLGSVLFISILILQTVLGQITNRKASKIQHTLTEKTAPAVALLSAIRTDNTALFLLVANRVVDSTHQAISNQAEQIATYDLPERLEKMTDLKQSLEPTDKRNKHIDSIITSATEYVGLVNRMNSLLDTYHHSQGIVQPEIINAMLTDQLSLLSMEIDTRISILQIEYNQEMETNFKELTRTLNSNSQFFLWTSLLFISFGLILTYRNIMSIVKPIDALLNTVGSIQVGNYDQRVAIKGTDELSMLGNAFNQMSNSLQTSFSEIKLKNKELEHFVYIASHDLQEPLRTVNSFTELLVKEYKDTLDETANTYIQFISQASTRMSLLVKGLLDYSRIGVDKELTLVNCNTVLKEVRGHLNDLIDGNKASIDIDDLPEIYAYETELSLLFQQLLENAIKFHRPTVSPIIKITIEEQHDFWKFSITDNGIGIKAHQQQKIFAIFHTLNSQKKFEGIGIGLAYCLKIATMHEGAIKVHSEPDAGSTFEVFLSKHLHKIKGAENTTPASS